jgi:hypothetical protein
MDPEQEIQSLFEWGKSLWKQGNTPASVIQKFPLDQQYWIWMSYILSPTFEPKDARAMEEWMENASLGSMPDRDATQRILIAREMIEEVGIRGIHDLCIKPQDGEEEEDEEGVSPLSIYCTVMKHPGDVQYELWNDATVVQRMTLSSDKKWTILPCPENDTIHPTPYSTVPLSSATLQVAFSFQENHTAQTPSRTAPDIIVPMTVPFAFPDILVRIRTYERLPLRVDDPHPLHKWTRVADVTITRDQLAQGACIPSFIPSDLYFLSRPDIVEQYPSLSEYQGHQLFYVAKQEDTKQTEGQGIPLEEIHTACLAVFSKMIIPEMKRIASTVSSEPTRWSRNVQGIPGWESKVMTPMNYRPSGRLLESKETDIQVQGFSYREFGGNPGQALWYCDSIMEEGADGTFTRCPMTPAATEEWYLECLDHVLESHGSTVSEFTASVARIRAYCDTNNTNEPDSIEWKHMWHDSLIHTVNVIRMHCTSRQYLPDHTIVDGHWIPTDEKTPALAWPGDCEDCASAVYQIMMTLVFSMWKTPEIQALQTMAALVGFPCGIAGTGAEPFETQGPTDLHHEGGHMYAAILPFRTFIRAITGNEPTSEHIRAFKERFGCSPPLFHTKPAIVESIFFATPFYSDHHEIEPRKKQALQTVKSWLASHHEDQYDWMHYTMMHVMGKHNIGQGSAFRLFTEAHLYVFPRGMLRYPLVAGVGLGETIVPCRSFLLYQPNEMTEAEVDRLFPRYTNGLNARELKEQDMDLTRIRDRVVASKGFGIPIEVLAHGRQVLNSGAPLFRLVATDAFPEEVVQMDRMVWNAYERPIVPLQAGQRDLFCEDETWMSRLKDALPPSIKRVANVPKDTNARMTVYVYDIVDTRAWGKDIAEVYAGLRANGLVLKQYKWCVACILLL